MAITKRIELKEEILPDKTIQIRTTTVVEEDGVVLARKHHRHVVHPGDDVTGEAQEVQDIAGVLWTADVVAAHQAKLAAIEAASPQPPELPEEEEAPT